MSDDSIKFKTKFAKLVSTFSHAPFLSIPAFLAINYFWQDNTGFFLNASVCILFGAVLPISVIILWGIRFKKATDMEEREDRNYPLALVVVTYFIGFIILHYLNAPLLATLLMFCYFSNTFIVFLINLYWKISVHSMGVAGPTTALIFGFGPIGSIFGLLIPIVMWSRVYLKKHTIAQTILGSSLGFILTALQIYWGFKIYNLTIDIIPILWLSYAFVAPSVVLSIAGYLNRKGMHDGYTRKVFHFAGFISIAIFLKYAPQFISIIFILTGILYICISSFSGNGFLWFEGIRRKSDYPNETLYVLLPMICAILGLSLGWIAFKGAFIGTGMLCVAIADAIAEPVGVKFGRHKYKVFSLTGTFTERSLEGSLSVLISCTLIIFLTLNNVFISLLIGIILSIIEAISPRGSDNLTILVCATIGLALVS